MSFLSLSTTASLRLLVAWAMLLAPLAMAEAQKPAAAKPAISSAYLTPQTVVAVSLRPRQILTNPSLAMMPIEVAQAAGEKYLGMDPTNITQAIGVVEPPLGATPYYAFFFKATKPWDLNKLDPEITQGTTPGEIAGRECLIADNPAKPCFMTPKPNMLVVGSAGMIEKFLEQDRDVAEGVLAKLVAKRTAGDDFYVGVDLEALRPLIQMGLMAAEKDIEPEFKSLLKIPTMLQSAEVSLVLAAPASGKAVAHCSSVEIAQEVEQIIANGLDTVRTKMKADMEKQIAKLRSSEDPVERAMAAYSDRMSGDYINSFVPQRDGSDFVVLDVADVGTSQLSQIAVIGVLVALLLPAVQAAREAARRNSGLNAMKQINLSMHNYHDVNAKFPAHAIYSDEGKPLLSWRVAILPYIEQQALYEQFHLDEPWDSDHNKPLIAAMPAIFHDPSSPKLSPEDGKSHYLGVVGDGYFFTGDKETRSFRDLTDGTSASLMIVQVNDAAAKTWTKPEDWTPDRLNPLTGLEGPHPGIFIGGYADGHAASITLDIDPALFMKILTINGGEVINNNEF